MTKEQWLDTFKVVFKLSWTRIDKAISQANKQYPYKLWISSNFDNQPCWYRIDSEADELSALKHFSHELRFASELYV